ncbi:MAG: hypothetical protein HZB47_01795 [Nitrosomonadales bacterium]|nr:hypothetical protein [Nitrosomonadales bacterium]
MKERINVRQIPGEARRRWFFSDDFDLIVWLSDELSCIGFELCYDKRGLERSISWSNGGFRHMAVDDGEHRPGKYKASPILIPDGFFDSPRVHSAFREVSHSLPGEIADYVLNALLRYPRELPGLMQDNQESRIGVPEQ